MTWRVRNGLNDNVVAIANTSAECFTAIQRLVGDVVEQAGSDKEDFYTVGVKLPNGHTHVYVIERCD